jgi:hypothetical protein
MKSQIKIVSPSEAVLYTSTINIAAGPKGDTGTTGNTGATGATGATGPTGQQGIQGIKGDTGNTGATGSQGIQGIQGEKGDTGNTGLQGVKGDTGEQGLTGLTGSQGLQGIQGVAGSEGPQGIQGSTGSQGQAGASVTLKGSVANTAALPASGNTLGDSYINDADGNLYVWTGSSWHDAGQIVGPEGPQGTQGIQGIQGTQGEAGTNGTNGTNGEAGVAGQAGTIMSAPLTYTLNMTTLDVGTTFTIPYVGNGGFAVGSVITLSDANYAQTFSRIFALIVDVNGTTDITLQPTSIINPATYTNWILTMSGQRGLTGNTGATGATGSQGIQGIQGVAGSTGAQGIAGETGPAGPQGLTGNTGATGAQGTNGTNGTNGTAATVTVGTTTTGATAAVTNSGTTSAAVLNFVLPTSGGSTSSSPITNFFEYFNDFQSSSVTSPLLGSVSGSSNLNFNTNNTNSISNMRHQCTNIGRCGVQEITNQSNNEVVKTFQTRIRINQLSLPADNFVVQAGFRFNWLSATYYDKGFAGFIYDAQLTNAYPAGSGMVASPNWRIATIVDSLTGVGMTSIDTGIAVDLNYHILKVVWTPTTSVGGNIKYYFDGVLIHTENYSNSAGNFNAGTIVHKNAGTNIVSVDNDYFYIKYDYPFNRL